MCVWAFGDSGSGCSGWWGWDWDWDWGWEGDGEFVGCAGAIGVSCVGVDLFSVVFDDCEGAIGKLEKRNN